MSGIFGGAQTVPTLQNTLQAQSGTTSANTATAANPLAVGIGQSLSPLLSSMAGTPGNVPLLNVLQPNQFINDTANNINTNQNMFSGLSPYAMNNVTQGGQYFPQAFGDITAGGNIIGQGQYRAQKAGDWVTPQDIQYYQNPFVSNVTQNLQDIFGQQNTQNLLGSTAAAGGAGSERSAVGQALLAQRQQLTAGNIYADLYQRSLQAAEQQKAQQLASAQATIGAGGSLIGAGTATTGLGATQGQLGLGTIGAENQAGALGLQSGMQYQQLLQQQQNAPYQQALGQYEDPFRRAAAVSGSMYPFIGLGQTGATTSAQNISSAGLGTSATTFPAPPVLPQLAGLGLAGAALFGLKRGGRVPRNHFDLGGSVMGLEDAGDTSGSMNSQVGMTGMGDQFGGEAAPLGGAAPEGSPEGGVGTFGGPQSDREASASTQTGPGGTPQPEQQVIGSRTPEEKSAAKRNQYALMQTLLSKSIRGQNQPQVPKIQWPQPLQMQQPQIPQGIQDSAFHRQEGGRVPTPRNRPFATQFGSQLSPMAFLNPGDEETEMTAHEKLLPMSSLSKKQNPYFNQGDKNNIAGDMIDPGTKYPMPNVKQMTLPSSGEAAGLYADGGAVGDDEHEPAGLPQLSPTAQAALSDDNDDEIGGEAAPLGGAPQPAAAPANPFNRQVTSPGENAPGFGSGMSPGKLALLQAGLGMMAASGQRDRHGLPMSPLGAIGAGGMQGVNTYQNQQLLAQRERAAREGLMLKRMQLESLERHRQALESMPHKIGVDPDLGTDIYGVRDPNAPGGFRRIDHKDLGYNAEVGSPSSSKAEVPAPKYSTDAPMAEADMQFDKEGDQEYLNTLSPDRRALLQKINRGEYPPPSMSSRSPRNMALLTQLSRAYPNSDLTVWKSRNETRSAFSKGVEGRAVASLDMIAGHLDDYKQTVDNLAKHNVKGFNKIENAVRDQLGGTALADFQVTRAAVSDELARVFQGAGVAAESEKERWLKALDDAKSPAQARAIIHRLTSLIESRMGALAHQYDRGMNYDISNPKARTNKGWLEGKSKEKFEGVKAWSAGAPKSETSIPQSYRDWGKKSPENAAKFREKFGEEP